jgi:hypothetical protein
MRVTQEMRQTHASPESKLSISAATIALIGVVNNKRARFVLDAIVKNGMVSTEEISKAGYEHPPRAARDVRELGFPLKTLKVKHSNGRTIAAYTLDMEKLQNPSMGGRTAISKKEHQLIIERLGGRCRICSSTLNLQVDHRIPYQVAGESKGKDEDIFQVLCGSCNRKKSWACEHCANALGSKAVAVCQSCYWSGSDSYTHVATIEERRTDLIWVGKPETDVADKLSREAKKIGKRPTEYIKDILKR